MNIDAVDQLAHLEIAVWGPALAGKADLLKAWYAAGRIRDPSARYDVLMMFPVDDPTEEDREVMARVEAQFGAPYEEIVESGALVVTSFELPREAQQDLPVRVTCRTVSGHAWYSVFRERVIANADVAVFVADTRPERLDHTVMSSEDLAESWTGPTVLFGDPAQLPFPFDGPASADPVEVLSHAVTAARRDATWRSAR